MIYQHVGNYLSHTPHMAQVIHSISSYTSAKQDTLNSTIVPRLLVSQITHR